MPLGEQQRFGSNGATSVFVLSCCGVPRWYSCSGSARRHVGIRSQLLRGATLGAVLSCCEAPPVPGGPSELEKKLRSSSQCLSWAFLGFSEVMSSATAKNQARSMILESPFIAPSLIEVWTRAYSNGVFGVVSCSEYINAGTDISNISCCLNTLLVLYQNIPGEQTVNFSDKRVH